MKILYLLITALKFAGIILLVLLLLLLLLIIIILIVPIKYRVHVNKAEMIHAKANIKWLYSIVTMDIIYNSNEEVKKALKLFGVKINLSKAKKLKKSKKINRLKDIDHPKKGIKKQKAQKQNSQNKNSNKEVKEVKKTNNGGIKEVFNQIQSFEYKSELFSDTLGWIRRVLKSVAPDYFYLYLEIGREDPADTGQLMAILSALYPFYYPTFNIVGNYEKECLYGKLEANGKIIFGRFIVDFIKYIRTRSMKKLIEIIRKNRKGKNNGRKTAK